VPRQESVGELLECRDGPIRPALGDRVLAVRDAAQDLLRSGPSLVRRQATMLAEGRTSRPAALAILHDVCLLTRRECGNAKAGERLIPKELAILAGRAGQGINGPLGDASSCHG